MCAWQGDAGAPSATPTPQGPLLQGLPEVPIAQFASEAGPVSMASPSVQPTPQVPAVLPAPLERPRSQAHLQLLTLPAPGQCADTLVRAACIFRCWHRLSRGCLGSWRFSASRSFGILAGCMQWRAPTVARHSINIHRQAHHKKSSFCLQNEGPRQCQP